MKTTERKMKFGGASPIIFAVTILGSIPVILGNYYWNRIFEINIISRDAIFLIASILLILGLPLYVITLKIVKKGFQEEKLITRGVFSICRNPLFAVVIILIIPGILLYFRSWLLLSIPLLFYLVFHLFISKEERMLEEKFGAEYLKYKAKTFRIMPVFWNFKK